MINEGQNPRGPVVRCAAVANRAQDGLPPQDVEQRPASGPCDLEIAGLRFPEPREAPGHQFLEHVELHVGEYGVTETTVGEHVDGSGRESADLGRVGGGGVAGRRDCRERQHGERFRIGDRQLTGRVGVADQGGDVIKINQPGVGGQGDIAGIGKGIISGDRRLGRVETGL